MTSRRPRAASVMWWFVTAVLLAAAGYCLTGAITQGTATRKASHGQGRPGTFLAETRECAKSCSWYGTFTPDLGDRGDVRHIELRGADEDSIDAGHRVRVRNVGPFVQAENGAPEWGSTIANSMGTFILSLFAVGTWWASIAARS
ncbi:MAG: hypothetical protein IRY90_14895 [Actinomadura rubrobrunea]|nr:hypothetical protein [Actinomadura rubrobrunea]